MAIKQEVITNETLLKEIVELKKLLHVNVKDEILRTEEAAKFLGLKPDTIRKKAQQGEIEYHKKDGKTLYFFKSSLINWVTGGATC